MFWIPRAVFLVGMVTSVYEAHFNKEHDIFRLVAAIGLMVAAIGLDYLFYDRMGNDK